METTSVGAESRKRKREEYEMQLFGFHSRAVYATIKNSITDRIQSRSRKLCETLENKYKLDSENLANLKRNEENLTKAYYTASLPHLNNIENIVNKFIAVPNNVLAERDKLQKTQYTEKEIEIKRKKLNELQQRAKRATILNAALKEELQVIEQFSLCTDNTVRLSHIIEDSACPDITEKLQQVVKHYKQLSASIKDPVSPTELYNTINGLDCIDYNLDSLQL